jgi:predicted branched-subunit amino acid permease
MRWKLLIIVSLIAAILAYGLWEVAIGLIFGQRPIQPHNWPLLASFVIPLVLAVLTGLFVYRHTARKRKTQALISILLFVFFVASVYFTGSALYPHRLRILQPCRQPPCI